MIKINEIAIKNREYFLPLLNFYDGEVLEFAQVTNPEICGAMAIEVKFAHGIHFVLDISPWNAHYYATKNGEVISHTYRLGRLNNDSHIYVQRLIDDIKAGRFDKNETPTEKYLNYISKNNLTSYMNKTRWEQFFDIIYQIKEQTGRDVLINYKLLMEEEEQSYWTMGSDEYIPGIKKRNFQWFKIKPIYFECIYKGRLMDNEYKKEDYTDLFLELINKTNIPYEKVADEEDAFIVYGYK